MLPLLFIYVSLVLSSKVLDLQQPNIYGINEYVLENPKKTSDLSYNLLSRSYSQIKEKCWNFLPYILKAESTPPFSYFPSTSLFEAIYQGLGPGPVM